MGRRAAWLAALTLGLLGSIAPVTPAQAALAANGPILIRADDAASQSLWDSSGNATPFPLAPFNQVYAFSPDGASVAYVGDYNLTTATVSIRAADGSDHVAGVVLGNEVSQVTFSGDGQHLAVYTSDYSVDTDLGVRRISVLSTDGSTTPVVIADDAGDSTVITGAAWDPSSDKIAFIRNGIVGLIPSTGGAATSFAATSCGWVGQELDPDDVDCNPGDPISNVAFAPDGTRVVGQFTHYPDEGDAQPYIGVQSRNAIATVHVASTRTYDGGYPIEQAAFSPDGSKVVFTDRYDEEDFHTNVYVAPATTNGAQTLVAGGYDPVWQPCPGGVCAVWSSKLPTSLSVSAPSPRAFGQTVPVSVTVTAVDGGGPPTGSVTVREGGTVVGTATLSSGSGNLTLAAPATLGTHTYVASYGGDSTFAGSNATFTVSVKVPSTLAGRISAVTWKQGAKVFITGTVTTTPATVTTGPIQLLDKGKVIKSALLTAANKGRFSFQVPTLAKGRHTLQLRYGGSTSVLPSSTGTLTVRVI